jgi:hypothetical protein
MDSRLAQSKARRFALIPRFLGITAALGLLLVAASASASLVFQDVSPNSSDLDQFGNPDPANLSGPDPNGASAGRVNGLASVAGNNAIFYAASEWGGLFKTTDGGLNWSRLDRHLPVAAWDVEVDPGNTNRVYATSFYDGRVVPLSGIQVSTDAGNTWARPLTAYPDPALEGTANDNTPQAGFDCNNADDRTEPSALGIAIRPDAANNVFVGTNCGMARSTDSGVTWEFRDPSTINGVANARRVWDVVVQSASAGFPQGIVDICGDEGHFRSVDGGVTYTPSAGALPATYLTDGIDNDGDCRNDTNNDGVTCGPGDQGVDEPDEAFLPGGRCSISVSPDEPYVLFVVIGTRIFESDNAGANWTEFANPSRQGRIPFLTTNQRSDQGGVDRFDLWFGDVRLHRRSCTTPGTPAPGGAIRCPSAPNGTDGIDNDLDGNVDEPDEQWLGPFTKSAGAHDDAGDLVFDTQAGNDACPMIFSSDGGVYYNTDTGADCHNPNWEQPTVGPHAQWLFAMDGADQAGDVSEDLYFGTQDIGSWVTTNAGAGSPTWSNKDCCDVFDIAADSNRVLYTVCCSSGRSNRLYMRNPGMTGGNVATFGEINTYPSTGGLPGFRPIDIIDSFGDKQYVLVDANGVWFTNDITANPIQWTQLGAATSPANACGVQAAVSGGTPTFFVQAGICNERNMGNQGDTLWQFTGTGAGSWTRVDNNDGVTGGIGVFAVDPNNPSRLYASNMRAPINGGPQMVFSTDSGLTWDNDPELDNLMTGGGVFKYRTERGPANFTRFDGYPQPTLISFDPEDPDILVAGGRDSGVFLSTNGGQNWGLLTDPFDSGNSGIPHLPRPWFAYFDHEPAGEINIYIGTQGRGVWRFEITVPVADCNGPYVTDEGVDVALDGTGSTGDAPLDYVWDFDGDDNFDDATGSTPAFDQVGQDGIYPIALKVTDPDGAFDIAECTVTVNNVPPSLVLSSDAPEDEGSPVTVSGVATDPGWLEQLTATIDWDDGTVEPITGVLENERPDATLTFDVSHAYGDNGLYNAEVCVFDDDTNTCQPIVLEINNVPPTVSIDPGQVTVIDEGDFADVLAHFSDPGWLDTYTSSIDWGTPAGDTDVGDLVVTIEGPPLDQGQVTGSHQYGDNGLFPVTVTVTDDDGGSGSDSFDLTVNNVDPTAEIDKSDAVLINGIPTFLAHAGEPMDFTGRATDPGSDDLFLGWDWDDGSPLVIIDDLVNPPNPDPFPSPDVEPRDVTDMRTHTFSDACLYEISFLVDDDDGGHGQDQAMVIITGNADKARSEGYWQHQYSGKGNIDFDQATLECYLAIVDFVSTVFNEERDASTIEQAHDVLFLKQNQGSEREQLDRELLTVWLNFANGAIEYLELLDTDKDGVGDTLFGDVVAAAEAVRLDAAATDEEIREQTNILHHVKQMSD